MEKTVEISLAWEMAEKHAESLNQSKANGEESAIKFLGKKKNVQTVNRNKVQCYCCVAKRTTERTTVSSNLLIVIIAERKDT